MLAEIGALNSLGYDRRGALWQVERAVRPAGELFTEDEESGEEQAAGYRLRRLLAGVGPAGLTSELSPQPAARSPKRAEKSSRLRCLRSSA